MILRGWEEKDVPKIAELEKECFADAWSKDLFSQSFSTPFFHGVLFENEGEIVAYACQTVIFDDAEILNVAVKKEYRGQGLAKKMLGEMENQAKKLGASKSFLEVRVGNQAAIGLYRRFEYENLRVRKGYYEDGEDALIMCKQL